MTHHSDWMRPQGRRLSRRAVLRAGARVGAGAAGLVLVGCGGKNEELAAAEAPAGEPPAVDEAERERVVAAVHPAIEQRAGVPVDRTTIGFPEASIEIIDFSDFQ